MNKPPQIHARVSRPINDGAAGVITRIEELSYELKVFEVMTSQLKVVRPGMPMLDVLELFRTGHISGAPVVTTSEGGGGPTHKLIGVISMEDIVRALRENDLQSPASKYMTPRPITARALDPLVEALKTFGARNVGRLPVVNDEGELVGIITKGDITDGVLQALQKDYQTEEVRRYRASHLFEDIISDRTSLILRYSIQPRDFTHGGNASSNIKRALLRLGADAQTARRCGIAVYEAEINLIIHTTEGGTIQLEIEPRTITIEVVDTGPGIPDVERAREPGYSTATDEVRELGFGAGMGLTNIQRCVDEMQMESTVGVGTRLSLRIDVPEEVLPRA
jgi:CBS domain-containing protein/anti-sigma regulatory factor (Ser/Thr protein kinase)